MSAPRRWIDEGGSATPFERDLLRSGLSVEPPPDAQKQVWAAVLAQIPSAAVAAGAGAAAAKATAAAAKGGAAAVAAKGGAGAGGAALAGTAGLLKSVLIGAGSAIALIATYSVVTPPDRPDAPPGPPAAVSPAPSTPQSRGPGRQVAPAPEPAPAAAPSVAATAERRAPPGGDPQASGSADPRPAAPASAGAPGPAGANEADSRSPSPVEHETPTQEESRLVGEARATLARGDAAGALARLDQIRGRFPQGTLGQEIEVVTIEALARSGRRAEASARASAFLQAHPTSVLGKRVQPYTSGEAPSPPISAGDTPKPSAPPPAQ